MQSIRAAYMTSFALAITVIATVQAVGYGSGAPAGAGGFGHSHGHSHVGNPNDINAEVRNSVNELKDDGNYHYQFDTTNGIAIQETGTGGHYAQGSAQYYSPEGQLIQLTYTADENGFQPQGAHLPTPPPIPAAIQKALEYIRAHPEQNGDDGHYVGGGTGGAHHAHTYAAPSNQYIPPAHRPSNQYLAPKRFH